ncbi:MAG: zinc ABC transporter substrate-binding protein [Deltaproteobacteria bacterium]|nr:zinc ABC transporter substrate-binding protein [Deltaproteobacteria bacterium]
MQKWTVFFVALISLGLGCGNRSGSTGDGTGRESLQKTASRNLAQTPLNIMATTGMVADAVAHVGGTMVTVTPLMGPGVDPHLYKASAGDIARLNGAELIFYNGLNLEGKLSDLFVKLSRQRPVVAVTEGVARDALREPPEFAGHYDPHLWFDVALWSQTLPTIAEALSQAAPAHAKTFAQQAATYAKELRQLDTWCRATLGEIPAERRVLVTAHDAFGYFGRAYDVEVIGLQGISTVSEFGLNDLSRIVALLVERQIPAVFVESSIPRRSIEAVVVGARAARHVVRIGGELYSDAMGAPNTSAGTYVGMVRSNVETIVAALRRE